MRDHQVEEQSGSVVYAVVEDRKNPADSSPPSPVMFWVLMLLASAVFAPCVIVPVWEDYQAMLLAKRLEADSVARLQSDVDSLERHLAGLQNDPVVIARLAQRDLGYTRPNERVVMVSINTGGMLSEGSPVGVSIRRDDKKWGPERFHPSRRMADVRSAAFPEVEESSPLASVVAGMLEWLPFADRVDVFTDPTTRMTLLCLSGGLMVAALALYPCRSSVLDRTIT